MEREEIVEAMRRSAEDGKPLGAARFQQVTGITRSDWGHYWPRIGDLQRDAGFEANQKVAPYDDGRLFESMIELTRELGTYPTDRDRRVKAHNDPGFPSHRVFDRLGNRAQFISKLAAYCADRPEHADIVAILEPLVEAVPRQTGPVESKGHGFVYLVKGHRGEYKIGRTRRLDSRVSELGAQASVRHEQVHAIETDDPGGVEAYWHRRFAAKRIRGEWFKLSAAEVNTFKRWKRIY